MNSLHTRPLLTRILAYYDAATLYSSALSDSPKDAAEKGTKSLSARVSHHAVGRGKQGKTSSFVGNCVWFTFQQAYIPTSHCLYSVFR